MFSYAQTDTLRFSLYYSTGGSVASGSDSHAAARAVMSSLNVRGVMHISIEGWSSPEGSEERNIRLAKNRAGDALSFVRGILYVPQERISVTAGIDWAGIREFSQRHTSAYADDVARIIDGTSDRVYSPSGQLIGSRKQELMDLAGGRAWEALRKEVFPLLRRTDVTIIYDRAEAARTDSPSEPKTYAALYSSGSAAQKDTLVIYHRDTVYFLPDMSLYRRNGSRRPTPEYWYSRHEKAFLRPVTAFRTNLLLPLLNVGVEVPIGNRWSVAGDFYYPWAPRSVVERFTRPREACFQGLAAYLEGRIWLGATHRPGQANAKYRLIGHSLGLVAAGGYYDWERSWKGQQGEILALGIGYMYALPLGRKGGVHLEFEVAVGVGCHISHPYSVHDEGGYLLYDKDSNNIPIHNRTEWLYGIPLKAGVTLTVPVFTDRPAPVRVKKGKGLKEGARR